MNLKFTALLCSLFVPTVAWAACDCGSIDQGSPCEGQSILTTVTATTVNGANSVDSVFSWTFNSNGGDARCGQFANGDYWIAPADGETDVTITAITGSDSITADADPTVESTGLLDGSNVYGNYNVSEDIVPNLPLSYSSTTSILAAIQRDEATTGVCGTSGIIGECVDSYQVVTVLTSIPENSGATVLRPNITGETKELLTLSDFNFSRIPAKSYLTGTDTEGYEAIRQRWSHSTEIFSLHNDIGTSAGYCSEGGRAFRSHILIDDYGGGVARQWNDDMMILFSDDNSLPEKQAALTAMLSYGLDLYHAMYDAPISSNRDWGTGATQHPGKFMPSVFLAALRVDQSYSTQLQSVSGNLHSTNYTGPAEMDQVHISGVSPLWGDIPALSGVNYQGSYWANLWKSQCYDGAVGVCNPAIGSKNMLDPYGYVDGPPNQPGTSYMLSSLGVQKSFVASMALMSEIYDIVYYPPLVTYVKRVTESGILTSSDECVTPDSREDIEGICDPYRNQNCIYYGVTWGPVDPTDIESDCIKVATPPYTKVGRFVDLHGDVVTPSYTSAQVENNWTAIIAELGNTGQTQAGTGAFTTGTGSLTTQ